MAERKRTVFLFFLFRGHQMRFRNLHERKYDKRQRENSHRQEKRRVGLADRGAVYVAHQVADQHRYDRSADRVARTAELHQLVPAITSAPERIEHRVYHGVQHTHRKTGYESADQIDGKTFDLSGQERNPYADETDDNGRKSRLLITDALQHDTRRNTHAGVSDEVGEVSQLRHPVRYLELFLHDNAHRVLKPRNERDHEEEREHHRYRQCVTLLFS